MKKIYTIALVSILALVSCAEQEKKKANERVRIPTSPTSEAPASNGGSGGSGTEEASPAPNASPSTAQNTQNTPVDAVDQPIQTRVNVLDVTTEKSVIIAGTLKGGAGMDIILDKLGASISETKPLYSQRVNAEERFGFDLRLREPGMYQLRFNGGLVHMLLLGTEKEVEVMTSVDRPWTYIVDNSPESMRLKSVYEILEAANDKKDAIEEQVKSAPQGMRVKLDQNKTAKFRRVEEEKIENLKRFIRNNDTNLVVMLAANYISPIDHLDFLRELDTKIKPYYGHTSLYQKFRNRIAPYLKLAPGAPAPEVAVMTPEGSTLTLSSLKGKYVLVDFWASWCGPCRVANPKLKTLYEKYKNNNFVILGVSLDTRREDWLRVVQEDQMTWLQGSELSGMSSQSAQTYAIYAIPTTYLVGPDGVIIAKNMEVAELDAYLKKNLK